MNLECKVKNAVSKSGNEYVYISIMIGTYEKKVFLEKSEIELLKLYLKDKYPQK